MTPTPLQRNEKVLEAFDEKKKELYNPDQEWNIAGETDAVEFGYRVSDGNSIYTVPFWGNIKKFISSALTTQRQEVLTRVVEILEGMKKLDKATEQPLGAIEYAEAVRNNQILDVAITKITSEEV